MTYKNLRDISEKLNQLACKECTKGWLADLDKSINPIECILNCFEDGLISSQLKDRLIKETKEIQK